MLRSHLCVLALIAGSTLFAAPVFVPGDLLWESQAGKFFDIPVSSATSNRSALPPVASITGSLGAGQITFSADGVSAYVSDWQTGSVYKLDANTGQVSTFATGISSPTGLIRTSGGKMYIADYFDGTVYDLTAGGNFSGATPWITGLVGPRSFLETSGSLYIAEQDAGRIRTLNQTGNPLGTIFATGLTAPMAMAAYNNRMYVTDNINRIVDFTSGGNVSSKTFASGQSFISLASDGSKLYSGTQNQNYGGINYILDVSAGGSVGLAKAIATNLPGIGDTPMTIVPTQVVTDPPASDPSQSSVPEPGTLVLVGGALLSGGSVLKRRS